MPLSEQQLALRRTGLGSSEIGAVAGIAKYATAMDVAARKLGLADDTVGEAAEWGDILEEPIAGVYARREGVTLEKLGTLQAPDERWMLATPDRLVVGRPLLLEIKTAGLRQADRWGPEGTDAIPSEYVAQATWEADVARRCGIAADAVDLAVLIGGQELRLYRVAYDADLAAELVQVGREFVELVIRRGQLPDPAKCRRASEYLQRRFPANERAMLRAEGEALRLCQDFEGAKLAYDHAEAAYLAARARLEAVIGDAEGIEWGDGRRVTWRKSRDRQVTDWQALAREAGIDASLLVKFTKTKPGPRVLRCYGIGDDAENGEE